MLKPAGAEARFSNSTGVAETVRAKKAAARIAKNLNIFAKAICLGAGLIARNEDLPLPKELLL